MGRTLKVEGGGCNDMQRMAVLARAVLACVRGGRSALGAPALQ